MPSTTLVSGSQGTFLSQPDDEPLIVVSSQSGDTMTATFYGQVGGTADSEGVSLAPDGSVEKVTAKDFQSLSRVSLSSAPAGTVDCWRGGQRASGDIRINTNPADGDQVAVLNGTTGLTYTFKTTPVGGTDVAIGGTPAITADNLRAAIDANDTLVDAALSAGTGAVVIVTDKIPIARSSSWNINQPVGSTLSIRQPIGGQTGALVCTFAPGQTDIHDQVSLNTPDLGDDTLPGAFQFTSDWVAVSGGLWTLELRAPNDVADFSGAAVDIANVTGEVLRTNVLALGAGALNALLTVEDVFSGSPYNAMFMRVKITNDTALDLPLHAAVTWEP